MKQKGSRSSRVPLHYPPYDFMTPSHFASHSFPSPYLIPSTLQEEYVAFSLKAKYGCDSVAVSDYNLLAGGFGAEEAPLLLWYQCSRV